MSHVEYYYCIKTIVILEVRNSNVIFTAIKLAPSKYEHVSTTFLVDIMYCYNDFAEKYEQSIITIKM